MPSLLLTPGATIKALDDDAYRILAIPFKGPLSGERDLSGEYFTAQTDLCLDWYPESRPLLFDHGFDGTLKTTVIGRTDSRTLDRDEDGWWVRMQLDRHGKYWKRVKELMDRKALYGSTGALSHLVQVDKQGEIKVWPWVEQTVTPIPCNYYARIQPAEATKHYEEAGVKAVLDAAAEHKLDASDFAYIDKDGNRHLPIHDEAHVRAALSRFNQTHFEDDASKKAAARKIVAAAKKFGIDLADGNAVAEAAKHVRLDELPTNWPSAGAWAGVSPDALSRLRAAADRLPAAYARLGRPAR
jgi:hypothetical protein